LSKCPSKFGHHLYKNMKDEEYEVVMQNLFDSADVNKDGVLDSDERKFLLEKVMRAAGSN